VCQNGNFFAMLSRFCRLIFSRRPLSWKKGGRGSKRVRISLSLPRLGNYCRGTRTKRIFGKVTGDSRSQMIFRG
jgi:hypothetical protein